MGKPLIGEVVVLPFPQTDLQTGKRRPALVVAELTGADLILCQITSQSRNDGYSISLLAEDFERGHIPNSLAPYRKKCFGLTIDPERLAQIRNERRPASRYASIENCRYEVKEAEAMMRREAIEWLSSTHKSIEEIATTILRDLRPDRLMY